MDSGMTKEQIISLIASSAIVENIVSHIIKKPIDDFYQDLVQDVYKLLLEKDESLVKNLWRTNSYRFWLARVLCNQIKSDRSTFYTNYRKPRMQCQETLEDPYTTSET